MRFLYSASRDLARQFQGSRFFEVRGFAAEYTEIERAIDRNEILLAVVIPRDYSQTVESGREAHVQAVIDGSDSNTASIALGYVETVVRGFSARLRTEAMNRRGGEQIAAPVEARLRVWYNTTLGIAMLLGRFAYVVPVMAIAGSLAAKVKSPASAGTFPTDGPLFVGLLIGIILILGGLQFLPALVLGPIVEHFAMLAGQTF